MIEGFSPNLLHRDGRVGVAVSGGADSIALLYLLSDAGFSLVVLHVNHQFRGAESNADEEFVSQKAADLKIPFLVHRPEHGPGNLEQEARRVRYRWFRDLIRRNEVSQVATAHTADDQAETVLFRFLRGSGTAGLSGVRPTVNGIVRPLLETRRASLRLYLQERGISWREDSSNSDPRFRRNRIRHELLPHLERNWNPGLVGTLTQTAAWAQGEEEFWRDYLRTVSADWLRFEDGKVTADISGLSALPTAVARRVIRRAIEHAQGDLRDVPFAQVDRVLSLSGGSFETKRWRALRSGQRLLITAASPPSSNYRFPITPPCLYHLPGQVTAVDVELKPAVSVYNDSGQQVDWALVFGSLELRNWQPGDRFRLAGHRTFRKLKRFFQEAGIPLWERTGWPVITCGDLILWTRRQGVAAGFAPTSETKQVLTIREIAAESTNQNASA